jgi:hypothetical protein
MHNVENWQTTITQDSEAEQGILASITTRTGLPEFNRICSRNILEKQETENEDTSLA